MRVILIGCGAAKLNLPQGRTAAAKDLYTGGLFRKRRRYAESSGERWFIVSAHFGLLEPEEHIYRYNVRLTQEMAHTWALRVRGQLLYHAPDVSTLEIHAGEPYASELAMKMMRTCEVVTPLQGLGIGKQLRWYADLEIPD